MTVPVGRCRRTTFPRPPGQRIPVDGVVLAGTSAVNGRPHGQHPGRQGAERVRLGRR
ncbi:MAG: hypothetical protein ACLTG4_10070 [Oscillospiraceae bacterium]